MDVTKAIAAARQDYSIQREKLAFEFESRMQAAGIHYASGLFGNLISQEGYTEIRSWRNAEAEKIGQEYINRLEGIALMFTT